MHAAATDIETTHALALGIPCPGYQGKVMCCVQDQQSAPSVRVALDTLAGVPLTVVATQQGVTLSDQNPSTPDARVLSATRVCRSVVNDVDVVPLPFA